MSVCAAPTCSHQGFDGSSYYVDVDVDIRCYSYFVKMYIPKVINYFTETVPRFTSYNSRFDKKNSPLISSLPPNLKLIQNIDLFKRKYTDYLMSKQNNEWLWHSIHYTQIVIFCCEYVCIVWNCICCIWLLLFWGPQGRLAYCC